MKRILTLVVGLFLTTSAFAQHNDFLTDYKNLKRQDKGSFISDLYMVPNAVQRLADYDSIMVDQPEIFIASRLEIQRCERGPVEGTRGCRKAVDHRAT